MKPARRRDGLILAAAAILIGVLAFGAAKGKGKNLPRDERHQPSYDALDGTRPRADVELLCLTCHSQSSVPLPKNHPPKEQCLLCHLPVDEK